MYINVHGHQIFAKCTLNECTKMELDPPQSQFAEENYKFSQNNSHFIEFSPQSTFFRINVNKVYRNSARTVSFVLKVHPIVFQQWNWQKFVPEFERIC